MPPHRHFLYSKRELDQSPEEGPGNLSYIPRSSRDCHLKLSNNETRKVGLRALGARAHPQGEAGRVWSEGATKARPRVPPMGEQESDTAQGSSRLGRSGQHVSTANILRGFYCNLESDKLTSLNPSNALQSKIKSSGIKSNGVDSTGRERRGRWGRTPGWKQRASQQVAERK